MFGMAMTRRRANKPRTKQRVIFNFTLIFSPISHSHLTHTSELAFYEYIKSRARALYRPINPRGSENPRPNRGFYPRDLLIPIKCAGKGFNVLIFSQKKADFYQLATDFHQLAMDF